MSSARAVHFYASRKSKVQSVSPGICPGTFEQRRWPWSPGTALVLVVRDLFVCIRDQHAAFKGPWFASNVSQTPGLELIPPAHVRRLMEGTDIKRYCQQEKNGEYGPGSQNSVILGPKRVFSEIFGLNFNSLRNHSEAYDVINVEPNGFHELTHPLPGPTTARSSSATAKSSNKLTLRRPAEIYRRITKNNRSHHGRTVRVTRKLLGSLRVATCVARGFPGTVNPPGQRRWHAPLDARFK